MKILYHHRTQGRGAEGVHIREIIKALRKLGHEVFVVSPPGVDVFEEESKPVDELASCELKDKKRNKVAKVLGFISRHIPQIGFELLELTYNFVVLRNISKILKEYKIDFIYERYAFFCWAGTNFAQKNSIPIILEANEVSGIKRVRDQVLVGLARRIEQKIFKQADAIVVVSDFLKRHIANMVIPPDKIHVIPNAVNLDEFNAGIPTDNNLIKKFNIHGKIILGFVGGLVKWHNFSFLFEVLRDIVNEAKMKIILLLVGDGPLRPEIEALLREMNIYENVVFTGNINHQDVPKYIKLMGICLIPHSNEFRSPIKMFEYMAMAKPVIAPRLDPIKDVITHNVNGVLFEPENEISLKNCLLDLINDNQKRERLGKEARNTVLSKHLWKQNAERIIQIYNRVKERC